MRPRICRVPTVQVLLLSVVFINLIALLYLYRLQQNAEQTESTSSVHGTYVPPDQYVKLGHGHMNPAFDNSVTLVLYEFEDFENNLAYIIKETLKVLPGIRILVIGENLPYPPLQVPFGFETVTILLTKNDPRKSFNDLQAGKFIHTEYVVLTSDVALIDSWETLKVVHGQLCNSSQEVKAVAVRIGSEPLKCRGLKMDARRWTLFQQDYLEETRHRCMEVIGEHGLFLRTRDFLDISQPFLRPFPDAVYIQFSARKWRVNIFEEGQFFSTPALFKHSHYSWKHRFKVSERKKRMYKDLGIKLVSHPDETSEYFGCTKETERCFGTIIDDMPEYIYEDRWTPPCCLKALRETVKHVFHILDMNKVRYWLEGGSLIGSIRHKDVIPWDYDVDIGMYKDDIKKCALLVKAGKKTFLDEEGYQWEKAVEGEFFRVQYSDLNHMHVDIYPFYSKNGTMTKDTWIRSHKQDTEFPEKFLKSLSKIGFAGVLAPVPVNVIQFAEFKFGKGSVDVAKYPNGKIVPNYTIYDQ